MRFGLSAGALGQLKDKHYCVLDSFFSEERAHEYRREIRSLVSQGLMQPNKTHFGLPSGQVLVATKPNIYEADLHDGALRSRVPSLNTLFEQDTLVHVLNERLPGLFLEPGANGKTIKLQYNSGNGGCFPLHYDNPGRPNRRKLTCLLYLNPDWKQGDGGELQLVPFLQDPVTIEPLMNRMVIFYSESVLHRVLRANAERFCFTIWLDAVGSRVNMDEHNALRMKPGQSLSEVASYIRSCPVQRIFSRALYKEEYESSLRECMEGQPVALEQMIALHHAHLKAVDRHKALGELVEKLRRMR